MNKLGWCRGIADARLLRDCGFDFIECPLAVLPLEDEAALRRELAAYKESPLPVSAFNSFFPGSIKIVGPEAEPERIRRYIHAAARVLGELGSRIAVLGSGKSRRIPDGWEKARAEEQLLRTLAWIAGEFDGTKATLAIEPLNAKEDNFINRVSEAAVYAGMVGRPQVRVLADLYHMDEEREPLEELLVHREWLAHVHIADSGRLAPGTGQYPLARFVGLLRDAGYAGMISAECTVVDAREELPRSLAFIQSLGEVRNA